MDINPIRRTDDGNKILWADRIGVGNCLKTTSQQGSSQKAIECIRNLANRGELGAKTKGVG